MRVYIIYVFLIRTASSLHNVNYVVFFLTFPLNYKPQPLNFTSVFHSCGHDIDSGSFDITVTKDVR